MKQESQIMISRNSISLSKYSNEYFGKYLNNDTINEICYNGENQIFYEDIQGNWHKDENTNIDFEKAMAFATSCASFKKDVIDKTRSMLSCVLPTGERVQIVIPPSVPDNIVSITIRKPSKVHYKLKDYIENGSIDKYTADTFINAVENGKNIVICGETGSGKTTFMKTLIDFIPVEERIITIEDVPEIKFYKHKNVVPLFYPSEYKTTDFITPTSLLKSCLRMKPDRILLAEVRGAETYDFLNVISSGHNGSMTSCHAGSVAMCITRLVMMSMQNEVAKSVGKDIILDTIKNVIDLIVVFKKEHGKRQVTEFLYDGVFYKNFNGTFKETDFKKEKNDF